MNIKKDIVVLAALLHDIGKFGQRAEVPCRYERNENEMQRVCKYDPKKNSFSHRHTLWTVEFFEANELYFPDISVKFDNADDNLANFAAKHHKPDTPLQWLVAEADRLSSGMDRLPDECEDSITGRDRYKKVRLYPILEKVDLEGKKRDILHRTELNPLSLDRNILFPKSKDELDPKEDELLTGRYKTLWNGFEKEFRLLPNGNISVFTESLLYLMEKYTWCIPSSTMDLPDISLFDHSRTTAAIAACLYDYHDHHNRMTDNAVKDREDTKYLLVCGDVSGIQKFIYNITAKGAAKGLKGRSFMIQLLSEAAGRYILRKFDYPASNLLYVGGGRFYLLIANRYESDLKRIRLEINEKLLEKYNGEIYLALGYCELNGKDFEGKNFPEKWKKAAGNTNEDKRRKFAGLNYGKIFGLYGIGGEAKTCQICKKEEDELESVWYDDEEVKRCHDCKTAEELGQKLSKAKYLVEVYQETKGLKEKGFDTPIPHTRYYLTEDLNETGRIVAAEIIIYKLNDTDFLPEKYNAASHAFGFKFAGGAGYESKLMFDQLTKASTGLKRLGILRMDVDNLGQIFTKGLGKEASISRVAGLSRQLSMFFGGYLNVICQKNDYRQKTLIIYSGGDDLFIVGAWDKIIELAPEIRKEFGEFACNNPAMTLSGGIAMAREKYPIYRSAEHAGDAEDKAKEFKRKDGGKEKDALTFLNKPLGWDDLDVCRKIKDVLYPCVSEGKDGKKLPTGILNRLTEIYLLYEENRRACEKDGLEGDEFESKVRYNKWVWRAVYTLSRAAKKSPDFKDEIHGVMECLLNDDKTSGRAVIEFIDVPVRWVEFLIRKEKN